MVCLGQEAEVFGSRGLGRVSNKLFLLDCVCSYRLPRAPLRALGHACCRRAEWASPGACSPP